MGFTFPGGHQRILLSKDVRHIAADMLAELADQLLAAQGLTRSDVRHWVLHSAGRSVIERAQRQLGLSEAALAPARAVLRQYGNMSSATVIFVLQELLETAPPTTGRLGGDDRPGAGIRRRGSAPPMVMGPDRLAGAIEMMDLPDADPAELARTLRDLAWINRWLGGRRLVRRHLSRLLEDRATSLRILDVATGYADIPRAIVRWGRRRDLSIEIEAVDHHDQILRLARQSERSLSGDPHPQRRRPVPSLSRGRFDIVLASLVLHHMEGEDQVRLLRELYRVARRAVLVNDLRRGHWPFLVTWASLHALSRSRLILHDGPLSVRRGFLPGGTAGAGTRGGLGADAGVSPRLLPAGPRR